MTRVQITLPENLAKKARAAGLLEAKAIQRLLQEELLRRRSTVDLVALAERIQAANTPLTPEKVQVFVEAEIDAYRSGKRGRRTGRP